VIIGGNLNFSLGEIEAWGPRTHADSQTDLFRHILSKGGLLDLAPLKLCPTWRNKRTGEDQITKRLDRFLIFDKILNQDLHYKQWVGSGGESNHSPILLDIE
jgi:hypothetical protein